ncbi:MAG: HIT domain-containing protein [Candidatus Niyogibacteria bacterium]|nr:HIT domain-containing protein [Candidatus Niyogibacteria bacterium]
MEGCLFCEIAEKKRPAEVVFETDEVVIFKDANPKARVHLLVVPKKHIASVKDATDGDRALFGGLILAARDAAARENLAGYKLLFNVGRDGGQVIDHVHLHLIAS